MRAELPWIFTYLYIKYTNVYVCTHVQVTRSQSDSVTHYYRYVFICTNLYFVIQMYMHVRIYQWYVIKSRTQWVRDSITSTSDTIAIGFCISLYRYVYICTNLYFVTPVYMYVRMYQWYDRNRILFFIIHWVTNSLSSWLNHIYQWYDRNRIMYFII